MNKIQTTNDNNEDFSEDLPPEIAEVVEKSDNPKETIAVIKSYSASWKGILPPPDQFNKYSLDVQKEIVAQATTQMKHRQKIETKVIKSNIDTTKSGMKYAFFLSFLLILGGILLLAIGKTIEGLGLAGGPSIFHGGNYIYQQFIATNKTSKRIKKENDKQVRETN